MTPEVLAMFASMIRFQQAELVKGCHLTDDHETLTLADPTLAAMQHAVDMLEAMSARLRAVRSCEGVGRG